MADFGQYSQIQYLLKQVLTGYESGAIVTSDSQLLALKYESTADIGTLGVAAQSIIKYLKCAEGDVALVNDPYSGGTILSSVTLVMPFRLGPASAPVELALVIRTSFRPHLSLSHTIEEEGLRIPPMPIASVGTVNEAIISAMESHPHCPDGFRARVGGLLESMAQSVRGLKALSLANPNLLTRNSLKNYLKLTSSKLRQALNELPQGECKVQTSLDQGENILLKLEINDEKLQLDFRGTSSSKQVCLTDSATFGAAAGAIIAFFDLDIAINSGFFSCIEVSSPLGCLLNSKYPSPTFKGMTDGIAIVASTTLEALQKIVPQKSVAQAASVPAKMELLFSNGKRFFDYLPGGSGASSKKNGTDGVTFWMRNKIEPSVEEIEKLFPLRIHAVSIRKGSGGKGHYSGGNGLSKHYELLAPAKLSWMIDLTRDLPQGQNGGKAGLPAEIQVQFKNNKEKRKLTSSSGSMELEAGDMIFLMSAGGGGFGPTPPESP